MMTRLYCATVAAAVMLFACNQQAVTYEDSNSDPGPPRFRAVLEGDTVVLTALGPAWLITCEGNPALVQRDGDDWMLLGDERPTTFNEHHAAHYLDGSYHSDCQLSLGCDVVGCVGYPAPGDEFEGFSTRLLAREYVQIGKRSALSCDVRDAGSDPETRWVPDLESRPASGPLGVRIRYFVDPCQTEPITAYVAVE